MIVTCEMIKSAFCIAYDMPPHLIYSRRRTRELVEPRHLSWNMARELTPRSYPEIGRYMGGYDHTTVLSACRSVETRLKSDHDLTDYYTDIKAAIIASATETDRSAQAVFTDNQRSEVLDFAVRLLQGACGEKPVSSAMAKALAGGLIQYASAVRSLWVSQANLQAELTELRASEAQATSDLEQMKLAIAEGVFTENAAGEIKRLRAARTVAFAWQQLQLRRYTPFEKADQAALEAALKELSPLYKKGDQA